MSLVFPLRLFAGILHGSIVSSCLSLAGRLPVAIDSGIEFCLQLLHFSRQLDLLEYASRLCLPPELSAL
eukprot:2078418-Amphidinium_carterae.1